ncbi:DUF3152 domain-containing protein [Streptomyces sp. J2-1]|uniref:DUF3152 domain-containing protein n=1 Tax=Streptomyces corallincola TaxID=2851888 RepID=UPI001C393180|nr:DUF3152 domain-containing protein [Streptomyces corallincola]MBV2353132.1 DUF3152 domain-containing protein [Streptomyces corallincola]
MGRHSRRGPAPKAESAERGAEQQREASAPGAASGTRPPLLPGQRRAPASGSGSGGTGARVRGGHPEQREPGGGWGELGAASGVREIAPPRPRGPREQRPGRRSEGGPRPEYLEAFGDAADVLTPRSSGGAGVGTPARAGGGDRLPPDVAGASGAGAGPAPRSGGKGRAFTGVAAAAVTTVLAIVVAGQVADGDQGGQAVARSAADGVDGGATGGPTAPSVVPSAAPLTYTQKMSRTYPLSAELKGSGKFDAVPGLDKAPGRGHLYRYRVDVERGLGLDGALFAEAVQQTLNDDRSWAHDGAKTFERISTGRPDFVITLASPGTTAEWCAKSGLDTTEDNVSCDSASTERVMINAYRWAQGSTTYGDKIYPYRQMLINHEVGHRLGHNHVSCQKDGQLAPVMQQQTKFLDHDGIHCLPNPWPYPRS